MKKQNKDIGAIKKTIDELCTPNGISIGNENTKYTPVKSDKQPIVEGFTGGEWQATGNKIMTDNFTREIARVVSYDYEKDAALICQAKNMYYALQESVADTERLYLYIMRLGNGKVGNVKSITKAKEILTRINTNKLI